MIQYGIELNWHGYFQKYKGDFLPFLFYYKIFQGCLSSVTLPKQHCAIFRTIENNNSLIYNLLKITSRSLVCSSASFVVVASWSCSPLGGSTSLSVSVLCSTSPCAISEKWGLLSERQYLFLPYNSFKWE